MVINTCTALGEHNPIAMIHDVGAGGLSNALPERKYLNINYTFNAALTFTSGQGCWIWRKL